MSVRSNVEISIQVGQNNSLDDLVFSRDMQSLVDTLGEATSGNVTLAAAQSGAVIPLGEVDEARLVYIEADAEIEVTLGGVAATAALTFGVAGTYPTLFAGGETLDLTVDGTPFSVTFTASASLLQDVVNEINAAAALVGFSTGPAGQAAGELALLSPTKGLSSEVIVSNTSTSLATLGLTADTYTGDSGTPGYAPMQIARPANPADASAVDGVPAYFLATVKTSSISLTNLMTAQSTSVRYLVAGPVVSLPTSC